MSAAQCLSTGAGIRISGTGTKSGTLALRDGGTKGWWHPEMVASRDGAIQGWWHSGSQICKLGALLGLCLLVRSPSATVGTLPELGSSTWIWTGAPGETPGPRTGGTAPRGGGTAPRGGGTAPRAVMLPWPQELEKKSEKLISFPGLLMSAGWPGKEIIFFFVLRNQQCL